MTSKIKSGVLLLSSLPTKRTLHKLLAEASRYVEKDLYVDLIVKFQQNGFAEHPSKEIYFELIKDVYNRSHNFFLNVNVQVLLPPALNYSSLKRPLSKDLSICIANDRNKSLFTRYEDIINSRYPFVEFAMKYIDISDEDQDCIQEPRQPLKTYSGVVIGGTFDCIHDGHRLLISTALLLADQKLTVGIADGKLLKSKILKELIEPVDHRVNNVVQMIEDYKPGLDHKVVPLYDSCGPSGTDDDLHLLVVSQETLGGGPVVNQTRKANNLRELDVFSIELIADDRDDLSESMKKEGKVSSSAERVRILGTLRKAENFPKQDRKCYVIGITGGIASGKSSVMKRLQKLGAFVIDCDKLGHESYLPGRPAYNAIVEHFGTGILNMNKEVERRKLGSIVFSDPQELQKLNEIVWPEIRKMRQQIIADVEAEGNYDIVVFEGAVLFESGWDKDANEIWCCAIPSEEAMQRLKDRNGLSEEQAKSRLSAQMCNQERVNRSHVILSTFWEPEFTQKQIEKAWRLLHERIGVSVKKQSLL